MSGPALTPGIQAILGIGSASSSGNASDVPVALGDLTDGTLVTGTSAGKTPSGGTLLRTPQGDITLATDLYLKRGTEVMLQLDRSSGQPSARIVTVDGLSLGKYLDIQAQTGRQVDSVATSSIGEQNLTPDPVAALGGTGVTTASGTGGQANTPAPLEARLIGAPATLSDEVLATLPEATAQALQQAPPGTKLSLTIVQFALPDPSAALAPPASIATTVLPPTASSLPAGALPTETTLLPTTPLPTAALSAAPVPAAQQVAMAAYGRLAQTIAPLLPGTATVQPSSSPTPVSMPSEANEAPNAATPAPVPAPAAALGAGAMAESATGLSPSSTLSTVPSLAMPASASTLPAASPTMLTENTGANAFTLQITTLPAGQGPAAPSSSPAVSSAIPPSALSQLGSAPTVGLRAEAPGGALPHREGFAPSSPYETVGKGSLKPLIGTTDPFASNIAEATSAPAIPTRTASQSGVITATVIGASGAGELILQTSVGTLKLMNTPSLPIGSRMELRLDAVLPESETDDTPLAHLGGLPKTSSDFSAMQEIAAVPAPPGPYAPASLLPKPGRELMTEMLFLFSVLKGETDPKKWIGESRAEALVSAGKGGLLSQLGSEIADLRSSFSANSPQGWNQMMVPFQFSGQIEPVRLYWKRRRQNPARLSQGDQEHFLIDLTLSQWGRMQLDGLVKKETPLGFDLIVRSEQALGQRDEREIAAIYHSASEAAGFRGTLFFRHGAAACVPLPQAEGTLPPQEHSIVV